MHKRYTVQQGDCIASIGAVFGLLPDTIWKDPANSELKRLRKHGHILFEGDTILIPELRPKEQTCSTSKLHRFVRRATPIGLRFALLDQQSQPQKGIDYILEIDGKLSSGKTDSDGTVEIQILPQARRGTLTFGKGHFRETYELQLGHLDPAEETRGLQMRLANLGYYAGEIDGSLNDATRLAISSFQKRNNLLITGKNGDPSKTALVAVHGS